MAERNVASADLIKRQLLWDEIAEVLSDGILGTPTKRHQLNDYLGFGLSMKNRSLERPLIMYEMNECTSLFFENWGREHVLPYLRHGHSIQEQLDIQSIFEKFIAFFSRWAADYAVEPRGCEVPLLHYVTIQAMLTRMGITNILSADPDVFSRYSLDCWVERWSRLDELIGWVIEICDDTKESEWWKVPVRIPTKAFDHVEPLQRLRSEIAADRAQA